MSRSKSLGGRTTEPTLNVHIARLMDGMRKEWNVAAERTDILMHSREQPDIVVRNTGRQTIIIENEFMPAHKVEEEAKGRLGKVFKHMGEEVSAVIALRSPGDLKEAGNLFESAAVAQYEYALYVSGKGDPIRTPDTGWLNGSIYDLAGLTYRASVPEKVVQQAAATLQNGAKKGADILGMSLDASRKDQLAQLLRQEYGDGEQTRRMIMLILINALVYQYNLSAHYPEIDEPGASGSGAIEGVDPDALIKEWDRILKINYWPIFSIARNLLGTIPHTIAMQFIDDLRNTASALIKSEAVSAHDLSGRVFQELIRDRKYLATFYTRPASATLLANLAIPEDDPLIVQSAGKTTPNYRIADFACGTGALLAAAYRRILELHEGAGGDGSHIHGDMMKNNIVGCDVMPSAVHLTTSLLSGMYSDIVYENTKMYIIVYGKTSRGRYSTGSMELLDPALQLQVISGGQTEMQTGQGAKEVGVEDIPWRVHDLVIMNPPFTRPTNHEGAHANVPNPVWAGFGMTDEAQKALGNRAKNLRKGTCGNGNAGAASDFVALGDKMVKPGGNTAYILPLTVLAGDSWKDVRKMWTETYEDITVVTLASSDLQSTNNSTFSADTGMAEAMVICKKLPADKNPPPPSRDFRGAERASCQRN